MDNEQNNDFPERNRIFRMAKERIAEQNAALEADRKANLGKRGPKTGHTVEVIKLAKVVGRNKVPVVPEDVEHMAQLGCTDNEIAQYLGITDHSLRRNFQDELINGRHRLRTSLRQAQIRVALEGQPTMLVWLGKNLLSQNENGQANDDNRPLPWTDTLDDDVADDDETEAEDYIQDSDDETTV
jgi:AraC-like DNA-binding protein